MRLVMRSAVVVVLIALALVNEATGQRGPHHQLPQFDQLLADAGNFKYGGRNDVSGRSLDNDIVTSDGKNVLFELDELEPVPCEMETSQSSSVRVLVARSDAPVGSGSCSQQTGGGGGGGGGGRRKNRGRGTNVGGRGESIRSRIRSKRAATSDTSLRWPSTTIAYRLSAPPRDPFVAEEMNSINEAIAEFNRYTCINWVERTNELNFVNIIRDGGCYSSVGWIHWNQPNTLSLARGCASNKNIPIHELMHALGVYHQQSRPDRDQYVRIHLENVQGGQTHNFFKLKPADSEDAGTEYSYRSVMHYGKSAFSIDRSKLNTITTIDPAFQDIIGRATTFSFEDLQLINKIYNCDRGCTNTCPPRSYRDKNCNCYCPNEANFDIPAVLCDDVSGCNKVGETCNCGSRANACSGVDNTVCNTNTGACECDSSSGLIGGKCIKLTNIVCTEVGLNCQCSRRGSSACNPLQNTVCNTQTNACDCQPGFMQNGNGDCVSITSIACDRIGKSCFCSQKANACSGLANSYCDLLTDKCECDEDFFSSSGSCARAPECTAVGQTCHCSVQGQDACAAIPNSACDDDSEACTCLPSFTQTNQGICEQSISSYISNGMSVSPFIMSSISTPNNKFRPDVGKDPNRKKKTFGIRPNYRRLRAAGTGSGQRGAIETGMLPAGTYCISFSYKMKYGALYYQVSNDGVNWNYRGIGARWEMRRYFRKTVSYFSDRPFKVRLLAEVYPDLNRQWEVLIDPVIVEPC